MIKKKEIRWKMNDNSENKQMNDERKIKKKE